MQFRKDINALRAYAVIAVMLFHFNPVWVPGGFAGVDVFFVISGFLMTGIIFRGIEKKDFCLIDFYKKRTKRILPALSATCLFSTLFGFFFLYDSEYIDTLKQAISAITFSSNFYLWKTSGYFSPGSETRLLLHTWSLSTEWQFYILYPFILFILSKLFNVHKLKFLVLLGFALSFYVSIYASPKWVNSSYYLLHTRGWEMLLGGLAYFLKLELKVNFLKVLNYLGMALIFLSYLLISKNNVWPGYTAFIPTVGAFLILISNIETSLTKNKIIQKIGTYSYSIYLWHWIVVYLCYRYTNMSTTIVILGCVLSLLLGHQSYKRIEKYGLETRNKILIMLSFLTLAIFYISIDFIKEIRPISNTPNNDIVTFYNSNKEAPSPWIDNLCNKNNPCKQGGVFLWGDSHAHSLYFGLKKIEHIDLSALTTSACTPSINYPDYKLSSRIVCNNNNREALKQIALKKPEIVILATRHKHEKTNWNSISQVLKKYGVKKIIIFGPVPQFKGELPLLVAKKYLNKTSITKSDMAESIFITNQIMNIKKRKEYKYIDILNKLCNKESCAFQAETGNNYTLISNDYGHLNNIGSIFIINSFIDEIVFKK